MWSHRFIFARLSSLVIVIFFVSASVFVPLASAETSDIYKVLETPFYDPGSGSDVCEVPAGSNNLSQINLSSIAGKYDKFQSAVVKQLGGKVVNSYNSDQSPATPASVLKLIIAHVFLNTNPDLDRPAVIKPTDLYFGPGSGAGSADNPKAGQAGLTLKDMLYQTLSTNSSDTDANVLIDASGGLKAVNSAAHALGYTSTNIGSYYNDKGASTFSPNKSTASDLTKAMEAVYTGVGVNYGVAQSALRSDKHNYNLPSDANKWGATSQVTANSAVFNIGSTKYIITMYINKGGADQEISDATNDILPALNGTASAASSSGGAVAGLNKDYAGNQILTDAQLQAIRQNQPTYQQAAQQADIPWQMLAIVHLRETGLKVANPDNGQGIYQFFDRHGGPYAPGPVSPAEFLRQTILAAQYLKGKASANYSANQTLSTETNDANTIKDTFFSYNGRAAVYSQQAANLGFNQSTQGFEGSPYVMNRADAKRDPIALGANERTWGQIKTDGGGIEYPANSDYGAYVEYAAMTGLPLGGSCTGSTSDGSFIWPEAKSVAVTSCFGPRVLNGVSEFHPGLDISGGDGTPILAAADGVVVFAGPATGYGDNFVVINHGNGFGTSYGHMGSKSVKTGDHVTQGQQIGTEDSEGHAFGSHLHFNVFPGAYKGSDKANVDPLQNGLTIPAGVTNANNCQ